MKIAIGAGSAALLALALLFGVERARSNRPTASGVTLRPEDVRTPLIADLEAIDPTVAETIRRAVAEVRARPADPERYGRLGRLYQAHQYYTLARRCYEIAIGLGSTTADWPYYLGVFAADRGRPEEAVEHFRNAGRLRPDYLPLYVRLGDALVADGDLDAALRVFTELVELDETSSWGELGVGKVLRRRGDNEAAAAAFERALAKDPDHHQAHYLLARTYRSLDRDSDAEPLLQRLAAGDTTDRFSDPLMETASKLRADFQSAIAAANQALDRGDVELAQRLYFAILERDPDHFDSHHNLGVIYGRLGRFQDAASSMRRAIDARPESREAHHGLAMALASLQRLEEAATELRRALAIDPGYQPSRDMLADLERHMAAGPP